MKNQTILLLTLLALFLFAACQDNPANETTNSQSVPADSVVVSTANITGEFKVNTETSVVEWKGTKPTGSFHHGTIKIQSGTLNVFSGNVNGGKIMLDMGSIAVSDLTGQDKADLEGHLKDSEFFEVAKFPTGSFEFGSTQPITGDKDGSTHIVAGSLTLKGTSNPIRIPAKITVLENKVIAETPEFAINRTEWGVKYKSGIVGTIQDELIDDMIKLKIKLEADIVH